MSFLSVQSGTQKIPNNERRKSQSCVVHPSLTDCAASCDLLACKYVCVLASLLARLLFSKKICGTFSIFSRFDVACALHECYDIAFGIITLVVPQDGEERHLQNPAHHFKHELEEEHRSKVQGCSPSWFT